ncbi:MAG: F0F1 ATP synthase subunit epsilon [Alphaproteobacteria bacterium]|nr:MAG: F0F1 ATP synthase subunit epsilon [Alphaproteobacteria bacterium]
MAKDQENTFHFELVSPERLLMDMAVSAVRVPGAEGDFMVLPNHAPVMSTIRPGVLDVYEGEGKTPEQVFVRGGFAEVTPGTLVILAEEAVLVKELSKSNLKQKITDAREDLEDAKTDEDKRKAQEAIARLTELLTAVN